MTILTLIFACISTRKALLALIAVRDGDDLLGKHINVATGAWTERLSGIGSNGDSLYEYLIKGHQIFKDDALFTHFITLYSAGI